MTVPNAGSAAVSIVPDLRGFFEDLSSKLLPGIRELGDEIGRLLADGMTTQVKEGVDDIRARLDELGTRSVDIRINLNDNGSIARTRAELDALNATSSGGDLSGRFAAIIGAIVGLGPAAVGAAAVAIPAIIAIGAAATGAVAGLGVLGLGFSGISDALQAAGQPTSGGGSNGNSAQSAAIRAQQQQISAAQATQSAQDQLTSAVEQQQTAELNLATAQRTALQAQQALTAARVAAAQNIQDLNNDLKDNALSQRQAAITLADAQQQLLLVKNAPGAGLAQYQTQVAAAQLAYDQAKQNAAELALTGSRLATSSAAANKAGVNGAPGVVSAQQNVADAHANVQQAQQGSVDAAHALAEAQANVTITAQQNALAAQQAAISTAAAAGATNAFAAAMAKLNPIQQQFVEFLLKLKPLFDDLKLAASGFLPGLEQGITNALPLFQPLLGLVGAIATAMGNVFAGLGASLAGPEGQKFITFLTTELPGQIAFLGGIALQFGRIFSGVFEQFAPLIKVIDDDVLAFLTNLGNTSQTGGFAGFIKELEPLIGPVFKTLGSLGGLIGSIFQALIPAIGPSLTLIQTLAKAITPLLAPIGQAIGIIITAVTPIVPVLGSLLKGLLPPLVVAIGAIAKLVPQLLPFLAPFVASFIKLATGLTPILPAIVKGLSDGLVALTPVMPQLAASLDQFVTALLALLPALIPILPPLIQLVVQVLTTTFLQQMTLFVTLFADLLTVLLPVLTPLLQFTAYTENLTLKLETFIEAITGKIITDILNFGASITQHLLGPAKDVGNFFEGLPGTISNVIDRIGTVLGGLPGKVSGLAGQMVAAGKTLISALFQGLEGVGGNIGDFGKSVVDSIIDGLNGILPHSFKIGVDKGPFHLHETLPLFPTIPRLALGGIIPATPGGVPFIGGEAGSDEAVIPLNTSSLAALANALAKPLANAQGVGGRIVNQTNHFYGVTDIGQLGRKVGALAGARSA